MHRITQKRFSSQGEKGIENALSSTFSKDVLTEMYESAYAAVVQPQRVVVIPRYFLHHWLPLLGPARAWLVLAFRQAAFVARAPMGGEVVRSLAVRQLTRWSGLSHGQIWNLLNAPETLSWFVRKLGAPKNRGESTTWGVQTAVPLAPHHLRLLAGELQRQHSADPNLSTEQHLQNLQDRLPALLPSAAPDLASLPAELLSQPFTLHRIVSAVFGVPLSTAAMALCDEITARVTQPGNTLAISHYFIDRWLPEFKNGEAWVVPLLRAQVYAGQAGTGTVYLPGGKTRLATLLGVAVRTVRRWLSDLESSPLSHFLHLLDPDSGGGLALEVTLREPIHPDDQAAFDQQADLLLSQADNNGQVSGQNWTADWPKIDSPLPKLDKTQDNPGQVAGQNWIDERPEVDIPAVIFEQQGGHDWTGAGTKLETVIENQSIPISSEVEIPNFTAQWIESCKRSQPAVGGVGAVTWQWDIFLQAGGIAPHTRKTLVRDFEANSALASRFFGWLAYAYAHPVDPSGKRGITLPVQFALSRHAHSTPAPPYPDLADLDPQELLQLLENPMRTWGNPELHTVISQLSASGFESLLLEALPPEEPREKPSISSQLSQELPDSPCKGAQEGENRPLSTALDRAIALSDLEALRLQGSGPGDAPQLSEIEPAHAVWERVQEQTGLYHPHTLSVKWEGEILELVFINELAARVVKEALQPLEAAAGTGLPVCLRYVGRTTKGVHPSDQLAVIWEENLTIRLKT